MLMRWRGGWLAFGVLLALASVVPAQESPPAASPHRTPEMLGGKGGLDLLRAERVQRELKLSEEQQKKLEDLLARARQELQEYVVGLKGLQGEELQKRLAEADQKLEKDAPRRAEAMRRQIEAILTAEQFQRFRQLELQQDGPWILLRADVVEALKMTEEQRAQLEQIALETQKGLRETFREIRRRDLVGPQDRESKIERAQKIGGTIQEIRMQGQRKAGAVLTRDQKIKLVELMGGKRPVREFRIRPTPGNPPETGKTPEVSKTPEAPKGPEGASQAPSKPEAASK